MQTIEEIRSDRKGEGGKGVRQVDVSKDILNSNRLLELILTVYFNNKF